jgi:hypothetical protein
MIGRPGHDEAAPYYHAYIDRLSGDDVVASLEAQLEEARAFFSSIGEERSLHRYAPEKWSIRQVLNHVNDAERVFLSRAFWFARGFDSALPSFDQNTCVDAARADERSWASHCEEFRTARLATLSFVRDLPADAWMRSGVASGNPFTVRALAYITGGHFAHHLAILRERYL